MRRLLTAALLTAALPLGMNVAVAGVPKEVEMMIRRAAVVEDGKHFDAVVRMAIETSPGAAVDIKRLALSIRPNMDEAQTEAKADGNPVSIAAPTETGDVVEVEKLQQSGLLSLRGWNTTAEIGAALNTGNTDSILLASGLDLQRQFRTWSHRLHLSLDYARVSGVTNQERWKGDYAATFRPDGKFTYFGFLRGERDRYNGLSYRTTESVGVGYPVIDTPTMRLVLEAGPGLVQQKTIDGDNENQFAALVSAQYQWLISDKSSFEYMTRAFTGADSMQWEHTAGLTTKVNDRLAARLTFELRKDTSVPVGTEQTNSVSKASLLYTF